MDESKTQLIDRLKSSNNILVTVGRDPSVDQLSALLGLTLFLNKQGKHAAAVFSGEVPSTLEFLKPEETIEKNTDSLRDFIIALDKSKADKLRYKVENDVVRIFITPYRTSISQDDFEFSQGDFNVDMVVAIGVKQQEDLDEAIIAHGRILHDATVTSINTSPDGGIGTINWHMPGASSLSELVCELAQSLDPDLLDEQISTAILTGIVAETDRFSNEKTTAQTMSASAALMAAGANQQLVASKLREPDGHYGGSDDEDSQTPNSDKPDQPKPDDGTLEITHDDNLPDLELPEPDENAPVEEESSTDLKEDSADLEDAADSGVTLSEGSKLITEPPTLGGTLTSSTKPESLDPSTDPLSVPTTEEPKLLTRKQPLGSLTPDTPAEEAPPEPETPSADDTSTEQPLPPAPEPEPLLQPAPPTPPGPPALTDDNSDSTPKTDDTQYSTLADLEESIGSPHVDGGADSGSSAAGAVSDDQPPAGPAADTDLDSARDEVNRALTEATLAGNATPEPIQALNAQPMTEGLHSEAPPPAQVPATDSAISQPPQSSPQVVDPNAPPPVPPPIPFQFGQQPPQQQ